MRDRDELLQLGSDLATQGRLQRGVTRGTEFVRGCLPS